MRCVTGQILLSSYTNPDLKCFGLDSSEGLKLGYGWRVAETPYEDKECVWAMQEKTSESKWVPRLEDGEEVDIPSVIVLARHVAIAGDAVKPATSHCALHPSSRQGKLKNRRLACPAAIC